MSDMCEKNPPSYISSPCIGRSRNPDPLEENKKRIECEPLLESKDGYDILVNLNRSFGLAYWNYGGERAESCCVRMLIWLGTAVTLASSAGSFTIYILRSHQAIKGDIKSIVFENVTRFGIASATCLLIWNIYFYATRGRDFSLAINNLRKVRRSSYFWTSEDEDKQRRTVYCALVLLGVRLCAALWATRIISGDLDPVWLIVRISMTLVNSIVDAATTFQVFYFTRTFRYYLTKLNTELGRELESVAAGQQKAECFAAGGGGGQQQAADRFQKLETCFMDMQKVFESVKRVLSPAITFKFSVEFIVLVSCTYTALVSLIRYSKDPEKGFPLVIHQTLFYLVKSFIVLMLVSIWGSELEESREETFQHLLYRDLAAQGQPEFARMKAAKDEKMLLSGNGFFQLEKRLILKAIGASITYSVILIQSDMS